MRSASQRRAGVGAIALCVALAGCVIIVDPDEQNSPVPVPVPLVCDPLSEAPVAHVYFSVRLERSSVNLEPYLSQFMQRVVLGLAGAGIQAGQVALVRADERSGGSPLLAAWGCRLDSPEVLTPSDVIRHYAVQEPLGDEEPGCATDPLAYLGQNLRDVVTQYPQALNGTNGLSVFGGGPDLVLMVHVDPLERRSGFDSPACASARTLTEVDADDGSAAWLDYAIDAPDPDRIVHWAIYTAEGVPRAAFVDDCRALEGFPSEVLDQVEPSATALYGPLLEAARRQGYGAAGLGFCEMLANDRDFLIDGSLDLGRRVGLSVDEQQVIDVLDNGLPRPGEGEDEGRVPPPDIVIGD